MAYPEVCFQNLVGIRNTCTPQEAVYWVDDIPGIDISKLAQVAESGAPTGEKLGMKLIESAARYLVADTLAIYDGKFKVQNSLVAGCSNCSFLPTTATGSERGAMIKNNTTSGFSRLILNSFSVRLQSPGTFTIIIDDGTTTNRREIEHVFVDGEEYDFLNVNYSTKKKYIRLYFAESDAVLYQLSCPRSSSGCGCSGASSVVSDLVYTGLSGGVEVQNVYGFKPCAVISCDPDDLLCFVAHSAPRMIGMALLFKIAELYFETRLQTTRNNKVTGASSDDSKTEATRYSQLYMDKLTGKGTRGLKDLIFTTLGQVNDVCVVCDSALSTSWAVG